jgi:eukaryotic-like serine/threonine-protein kinase
MVGWDPFNDLPQIIGGRYRIVDLLGEGGAGRVYRVRDEQNGIDVACKLVEAPALKRPLRFLAEARDMARLDHPRIVRVLDAGRDGHWYWMVMELLSGGSLKDRIASQGPMASGDALEMTYRILQGLHVVHCASLVHRDIKPHNVLLDGSGSPKLTDFGLARHEPGDVPWKTSTGESLGSPSYRAPEQARAPAAAGREADIFGLGGVLYFMVTGARPTVFYAMKDEEYLDATGGFPASIGAVIRKATSYRPEERYRSAIEMAAAIALAYDALPERAGEPSVAESWLRDFEKVEVPSSGLWGRLRNWLGG